MLLKDKVIIITGAAMGMGKASAELFADYGAKVVIADFNEEEGNKVAEAIKAKGQEALFVKVDVSNEEMVKNMVEKTVEKFGRLDGAVNNAAIKPDQGPIHEMDMAYYDRLMSIDLKGVILCMKYELQQFLDQESYGSIVNISSISGMRPQPGTPAYVVAKAGVLGATKQAALDYGKYGIRINSVVPGSVDTPMLRESMAEFNIDPVEYAKHLSLLQRFAEPDEVAEASAWLLSDKASYVTGMRLIVDGGYTSM